MDGYSKLREDVDYRRIVAEQLGLGFEIPAQNPDVVPVVPKLEHSLVTENAA